MDAAWQDAKLILSFAVGIIFMRSLEMLTIDEAVKLVKGWTKSWLNKW